MKEFLNIPNIDLYFVLGILFLFGLIEFVLGHYNKSERSSDDWILESLGFFVVAITKTLLVAAVFFLGKALLPAVHGAFAAWHIVPAFFFYIFIDDIAQYWYHRSAHEYNWLWKHHRVHHAAKEMGILTAYRNSWVYYLLMPNLWWGGIATFLGLAPAVIAGLIFKQIIVTSTHSAWKWDEILYKNKMLKPIAWLVEHIVITPSFHHGHHGMSQADHVSVLMVTMATHFPFGIRCLVLLSLPEPFLQYMGYRRTLEISGPLTYFIPSLSQRKKGVRLHQDIKKKNTLGLSH